MNQDIWSLHASGAYAVIPVNLTTKKNGDAVMGAGLALQAAQRFPMAPVVFGMFLAELDDYTEAVYISPEDRLILFPTKDHWKDDSTMFRICDSLRALVSALDNFHLFDGQKFESLIAMPRVGCGLGGLSWDQVKPVVDYAFDSTPYKELLVYCEP